MKCSRSLKQHCREMARKRRMSDGVSLEEPEKVENMQQSVDEGTLPPQCDTCAASFDVRADHSNRRSPIECTFATLMAGSSFEQMRRYNAQTRNYYPSKGSFYSAQKKIGEVVKNYAEESMQHARIQMSDGAQISADGRYPNRRNSSY